MKFELGGLWELDTKSASLHVILLWLSEKWMSQIPSPNYSSVQAWTILRFSILYDVMLLILSNLKVMYIIFLLN